MNKDYSYCANEDTCIHRRGCKRWLGNYESEEVKELYTITRFVDEVDESKCIPNYEDVHCENDFHFLDRFRLSTGEEMMRRKK